MAAGRDDYELSSAVLGYVRHRSSLAAGRQTTSPQLFPRVDIERAQIVVERSADEDETALGDDRAADAGHSERSGKRKSGPIASGAKRALPDGPLGHEIDCNDSPPRRSIARNPERRQKGIRDSRKRHRSRISRLRGRSEERRVGKEGRSRGRTE